MRILKQLQWKFYEKSAIGFLYGLLSAVKVTPAASTFCAG